MAALEQPVHQWLVVAHDNVCLVSEGGYGRTREGRNVDYMAGLEAFGVG